MEITSLKELYTFVNKHYTKVFVVPLIRFNYPTTDYLYLLYKDLLEQSGTPKIESISVYKHYSFVLAALFSKKTILHYHWLEFQNARALLAMPYKLACIGLYKLFGGNIVWTIHNLSPHDKKYLRLHRAIHKWMGRIASKLHVHSPAAISMVCDYLEISPEKIIVLKHPAFPHIKKAKEESIQNFLTHYGDGRELVKKPVILIFGGISEYKGIRSIIEILIRQEQEFTLIIAGYVKKGQEGLHRFIIETTVDDDRILYIPTFIPEEHYPDLLHTADICVFNYTDILTSGGVEMAMAYDKAIIAPNKGCLKDLQDQPLVSLFNTKSELEHLLVDSIKSAMYE